MLLPAVEKHKFSLFFLHCIFVYVYVLAVSHCISVYVCYIHHPTVYVHYVNLSISPACV